MIDKQLLKGSIKTLVLQILSKSPSHGYEISVKIKELSNNKITVTEGTLYPLLHSLKADKCISSSIELIGERKRKVYKLTKKGSELLGQKREQWNDFSSIMNSMMASYDLVG